MGTSTVGRRAAWLLAALWLAASVPGRAEDEPSLEELKADRKAALEAQQRRANEAAARKKAQAETDAQRQAEARQRESEHAAETARLKAEAEAARKQAAEAKARAEAEAKARAAMEARIRKAEEQVSRTAMAQPPKNKAYAYVCNLNPLGDNFLSMRAGPDSGYPEILRMPARTKVIILTQQGEWSQVRVHSGGDESIGWANGRWLCTGITPHIPLASERSAYSPVVSKRGAGYVCNLDSNGDNYLSLRSGPGTSYSELVRMPNATELIIMNEQGSWRYIQAFVKYSGTVTGWAYSPHICQTDR
jgi:uncharacterized protein YraI